jgi:hypothetical protein
VRDFLSGLLDRVLERAPVLQPRRPSLFESVSDEGRLGSGSSEGLGRRRVEEDAFDLESSGIEQAPVSRPLAPRPPSAAASAPTTRPLERESVEPVGSPKTILATAPAKGEGRPEASQKLAVVPSREVAPTSTFEAPSRTIETSAKQTVEKPQPSIHSVRRQVEGTDTPRVDSPPPAPPARALVGSPVKLDTTTEARSRRGTDPRRDAQAIQAKPAHSATQPALLPPASPMLPSMRRQPAIVRNTAPVAPTIQVTIGRIEVRANAPAATSARTTRPAAPKLNLEDYLRSRSGGTK